LNFVELASATMPRFGIKTLLFSFLVVALWLTTFSGYALANDVRRGVLLAVLAGSGYAAVYLRGRQRAFWAGFLLTMLAHGFSLAEAFDSLTTPLRFGYVSRLDFAGVLTNRLVLYVAAQGSPHYDATYRAMEATFAAVWVLMMSTVIGLVGLSVYDHCHKVKE
jgi:hypothetical protein